MKVAILHDGFRGIGGGENTAVEMAKTLKAPIYCCFNFTDFYDDSNIDIISLHQDRYRNKNFLRPPLDKYLTTLNFKNLKLSSNIVLLVHEYCLGYCNKHIDNRVILYHHNMIMPWVFYPKTISQKLQAPLWRRFLNKILSKVNTHLSNSELTQQEIKNKYNINSKVLYPPVETTKYKYKPDDEYYLVLARLSPESNIDKVVELFKDSGRKLLVTGSEWYSDYVEKVREMCDKSTNITYLGEVDEGSKIDLLSRCKALINPYVQTFGITTVEALSSGKPVIGLNKGYTPYQINNCDNGILVSSLNNIPNILNEFERKEWNYKHIQDTARKYDIINFRERLKKIVYEDTSC